MLTRTRIPSRVARIQGSFSAAVAHVAAPPRWSSVTRSRTAVGRRGPGLIALTVIGVVAFAVRIVPVLRGGGVHGLLAYDDGVYYAAAAAFVHGLLPYRDFLLLHPPGIVVLLSPFAALGTVFGDPSAFALARAAVPLLGAANAVLVALIAGRYGRPAGIVAGALYAVWVTAAGVERTTDLHGPQNAFLLLGLFALSRPGRIGPRRAAAGGAALGLATAVQLWQGVSVVVLLWWVVVRARHGGREQARAAVAYVVGAAIAFGLVSLPFLLAAPEPMIRYTLLDQVGRPNMRVGLVDRLRVLEGLPMRAALRALLPDWLVLAAAVAGLAAVVGAAWRFVWTRPWAVLAIAQTVVVLLTPSFFDDYPSLMAPAGALVIGTALATLPTRLLPNGPAKTGAFAAVAIALALLAVVSVARRQGHQLPLAQLDGDVSGARCVAADSPSLLVLTSAMDRNLKARCPLVVDPAGVSYDTFRFGRHPRARSPAYQQAMVAWYTSADVALFVRRTADALAPPTQAAIERRLPHERRRGSVLVRLVPSLGR